MYWHTRQLLIALGCTSLCAGGALILRLEPEAWRQGTTTAAVFALASLWAWGRWASNRRVRTYTIAREGLRMGSAANRRMTLARVMTLAMILVGMAGVAAAPKFGASYGLLAVGILTAGVATGLWVVRHRDDRLALHADGLHLAQYPCPVTIPWDAIEQAIPYNHEGQVFVDVLTRAPIESYSVHRGDDSHHLARMGHGLKLRPLSYRLDPQQLAGAIARYAHDPVRRGELRKAAPQRDRGAKNMHPAPVFAHEGHR